MHGRRERGGAGSLGGWRKALGDILDAPQGKHPPQVENS
jgi:hypothetical protein